MSYSDRLSAFNDAMAHSRDHIDALRKTLTNPELEENPTKKGLEIAGNVLGTGEGLLQVRRGLEEKGFLRRGFKAIASRLGRNPAGTTTGTGGGGEASAADGEESGARAGASDGAARADEAPTDEGTGGRSAGDSGAAEPAPAEGEGGGAAARPAAGEGEGAAAAPEPTPAVEAPARTVAGTEAAGGGDGQAVARIAPEDNPFSLQNFQPRAGDTTTITRGESAVDATDPFSTPRTLQQTRTSYGSNPTRNALANDGEGVPDSALPNSGGGTAGELTTASGVGEDVSDVGRATAAGVEEGQRTLQSAQQLQGRVSDAVGQSGTADSASGQANMVSQAQHGNAAQHAAQQNPNSEADADGGAQDPAASSQASRGGAGAEGAEGEGAGVNPAGSAGASTADEGAGSGIRTALGVEEGLDETLGEVPVIGPLLEGVSLLATLGTSIAGAFTPSETKGKSPAEKGAALPSELAVGANLKQNSGGAVGAY